MKPVSVDLSVAMVTYKTKDLLERCLGVLKADPPQGSHEIIVLDNASRDGTPEMVEEKFPTVRLLRSKVNHGFGRGCNFSLREASGRFILMLNPDAEVSGKLIDRLVEFLKGRPEVGIVVPRMEYPDGRIQLTAFRFLSIWRDLVQLFRIHRILPAGAREDILLHEYFGHDKTRQIDWASGACMLVRREVFDQVGLLSELTFNGNEDMDLCYRARKAGWKAMFLHEVTVMHVGGASNTKYVKYPETDHIAHHNLYITLSSQWPPPRVKLHQCVRFLMYLVEEWRVRLFGAASEGDGAVSRLDAARHRKELLRGFLLGRVKPIARYSERDRQY